METLEIKKCDAQTAHENAKKSGKKMLENLFGKKTFLKEVTERIKTFSDVLAELGESDADVIEYRKLVDANVSEYILGNQQSVLIAKALNEGWKANWDDSNERKYFPWFVMSPSGFRFDDCARWATRSAVGSRLCLKSSNLAKYSGEQFTEIHKKHMIIK